jgi:hypothetical protein
MIRKLDCRLRLVKAEPTPRNTILKLPEVSSCRDSPFLQILFILCIRNYFELLNQNMIKIKPRVFIYLLKVSQHCMLGLFYLPLSSNALGLKIYQA